jgi:thiol-disulfide isomerase/thioredoxin
MKKMFAVQVAAILIVSGALAGMFAFTPAYFEVRNGIVLVLCLSCLKLEPKAISEFTFETVDDVPHPEFILENLSKGPVVLFYSGDACAACDVMYPVIKELLSVEFGKQDMFFDRVIFEGTQISYIYINIHHTIDELRNSQKIYDKDAIGGIPMFTIVTLGYEKGIVRPKYTSLYGTLVSLGYNTDTERVAFLQEILRDSINMYNDNKAGYPHHE